MELYNLDNSVREELPGEAISGTPDQTIEANASVADTTVANDQLESTLHIDTHEDIVIGIHVDGEVVEIEEQPSSDYSELSKEQLIELLQKLVNENDIDQIKADIESIKINFYKRHKAEYELKRKEFVDTGNNIDDFKTDEDPLELKFKDLLKVYKDKKAVLNQKAEAEKVQNLKLKLQIVEEIKHLTNSTESTNDTYQHFKDIQKRWRDIGPVPQQNVNDLWKSYNHHVEAFYDFLKINKELRDLDLKRNLEAKIGLCENAEELLLEPSVVKAFKQLQDYHDQWKEIGPVPNELRNEIWNRFKDITSKINKQHQDYFEDLKVQQEKNLEAKTLLCEKAEEIANSEAATVKDFELRSKDMVELQNVWRTIGFAPKKDNNKIYERFRAACDEFFNKKRNYMNDVKELYNNNLQLKIDLCIQAESLKDSTEWKKATDELINIQKRWKEIGSVPRKQSDLIWKRFRTACDEFFNRKSQYFSTVDSQYEENFKAKLAIIEKIEAFQLTDNIEEDFASLKEIQRQWTDIGFVPIKQKEEINNKYRNLINQLFDNLKVDDGKRRMMKFKNKIDNMPHNQRTDVKINRERDKMIMRLKKLESDIVLWDNNIGFFANTKNAQAMIAEVQKNIDAARVEIKELEVKIKLIDKME